MANVLDIVKRYRAAFYGGDTDAARELLADDFVLTGPAVSTDPDKFIKTSGHVASGLEAIEVHKAFVDGVDVCVIFDLLVDHEVGRMRMVDWYHLQDDRIASIWTLFDMAPFVRRAGDVAQESVAIDPVCQMSVDKKSPAATHVHAGKAYHFCSEACAEAFGTNPEKYLKAS